MSQDNLAGSAADYCPHECPECGGPCYIPGGEREAQCIEKGCVFYNEETWVGWIMRLDDSGDPPIGCTEADYYPEDSNLDAYGKLINTPRHPGEDDFAYYDRLLGSWKMLP